MPLDIPALEANTKRIGKAYVYAGDPFTAGGLAPLALTEGDLTVTPNAEYSQLTLPEETGPAIHHAELTGENPVLTVPAIMGDKELYTKLSPTGQSGGGHRSHQPVTETSLVLVPEDELPLDTEDTDTDGTDDAFVTPPVHTVWLWRGYFTKPDLTYRTADGGKVITEVDFQVMDYGANPDGERLYTVGDPYAKGVQVAL